MHLHAETGRFLVRHRGWRRTSEGLEKRRVGSTGEGAASRERARDRTARFGLHRRHTDQGDPCTVAARPPTGTHSMAAPCRGPTSSVVINPRAEEGVSGGCAPYPDHPQVISRGYHASDRVVDNLTPCEAHSLLPSSVDSHGQEETVQMNFGAPPYTGSHATISPHCWQQRFIELLESSGVISETTTRSNSTHLSGTAYIRLKRLTEIFSKTYSIPQFNPYASHVDVPWRSNELY